MRHFRAIAQDLAALKEGDFLNAKEQNCRAENRKRPGVSVARQSKFSPKCKKWHNFKGEFFKALAKFQMLVKF